MYVEPKAKTSTQIWNLRHAGEGSHGESAWLVGAQLEDSVGPRRQRGHAPRDWLGRHIRCRGPGAALTAAAAAAAGHCMHSANQHSTACTAQHAQRAAHLLASAEKRL